MIVINKDIEFNRVALTLRENQSEETNYLLFVFRNDLTQEEIIITLEDQSTIKQRANIFCVPGDIFTLTGFYHYSVFENPHQEGSGEGLKLIECGKCKVVSNGIPNKAYHTEIINKVYDNT